MNSYFLSSCPDYKELLQGCAGYIENEKCDAMYKTALYLVSEAGWKPQELAEGLGVLLLTWNAAFYTKYGSFDFDNLESSIKKNLDDLKDFSKRSILSYTKADEKPVQQLFGELLESLKPARKHPKTPVGTAKLFICWRLNFSQSGMIPLRRNIGYTGNKEPIELPNTIQISKT